MIALCLPPYISAGRNEIQILLHSFFFKYNWFFKIAVNLHVTLHVLLFVAQKYLHLIAMRVDNGGGIYKYEVMVDDDDDEFTRCITSCLAEICSGKYYLYLSQ